MGIHRLGLVVALLIPLLAVSLTTCGQEGVVLWNTLGSQLEVEASEIGPDGEFNGGSFMEGMFGHAYTADHTENGLVSFPPEVIPHEAGCIAFWARLMDVSSNMGWGDRPGFVKCQDAHSVFELHFNGNDGAGNGGLCGRCGHAWSCGTGYYGSWGYADVLGAGELEFWHHYALVWDHEGIGGGTRTLTVFLDGEPNTGRWQCYPGQVCEFVPLTGGELLLLTNQTMPQGRMAIDNLVIYDYAKIDFSDRFQESPFSGIPPGPRAELVCSPVWGTLPFQTKLTVTLTNLDPDQERCIAATMHVNLAGGQLLNDWRFGYSQMNPGESYSVSWIQNVPDLVTLVGQNRATLTAEDVTDAPYNQPPYFPSGLTDVSVCTVVGDEAR